MASITNSRTLFFVTSPRSPQKMFNEIRLLKENFVGGVWNSKSQTEYSQKLSAASFYDGDALNTDFSARDRINRAPKALGLVDLDPKIAITDAGDVFLSSKRPNEIFTRQLLKFQLPSPYHIDKSNRFNIKPFLEIIRLVSDLKYMTKDELSMFGMQMIDYHNYDAIKTKILTYRRLRTEVKKRGKSLTELAKAIFDKEIKIIYQEELRAKKFKIRETKEANIQKFLTTKKGNLKDYTDAAIRYLRLAELITYERRVIRIAQTKKEDVNFILANVSRDPIYIHDENKYKEYLFDSSLPELLIDDKDMLISNIVNFDKLDEKQKSELDDVDIEILKNIRQKCILETRENLIDEIVAELETYNKYSEIIDVFDNIFKRNADTGAIDRPLLFEWNTWRAMAMLDDGDIIGNFSIDDVGLPLYNAPGGKPDIHCKYENFELIIEVTLAGGHKQYEMEGEPVARHLGEVKNECGKDTYCLFIAPTVSPATIAHFYVLAKTEVKLYGGKSKIIPIDIDTFKSMITNAYKSKIKPDANEIEKFLKTATALVEESINEEDWAEKVTKNAKEWILAQ